MNNNRTGITASETQTPEYDAVVIGGGLLGCFAARSLTRYKLKTALLEKREDLCTGISRANTAIVYSGCDTKPGTLKSSLCVRASQTFAELCDELGVRYSQCGSLMICFGERGEGVLKKKLRDGVENGVRGIRMLTRDEVLKMEPNLSRDVYSGLFVPETGTVMPWELCLAAAENAARNGADIILNCEATGISQDVNRGGGPFYKIQTNNGTVYARAIINCAGMSADMLHEMVSEPAVRIVPTAGDYFVLDTKASGHISHVMFHEPEVKGKGLTLVPTVDGNILVGPTERPLGGADPGSGIWDPKYTEGFETEHEGLDLLRELVSEVIPALPLDSVIRSFGAVRPNPYMLKKERDGSYVMDDRSLGDFCILESKDGLFISLIGVKTPGLTCANELGIYAAGKIARALGADGINTDLRGGAKTQKHAKSLNLPPIRLGGLPFEERKAYVRENPDFGRIVCRCRGISEGEIVSAIRQCPGAVTADGVKRRTGAGSGRCQGGFCGQSVNEIVARELGRIPEFGVRDPESGHISPKATIYHTGRGDRPRSPETVRESNPNSKMYKCRTHFVGAGVLDSPIFRQGCAIDQYPFNSRTVWHADERSSPLRGGLREQKSAKSSEIPCYDVVVIGGGPAGMAAALAAAKPEPGPEPGTRDQKSADGDIADVDTNAVSAAQDVPSVLLIERGERLGGILNQCTHTGFGLTYFGEELSGQEYARRFVERVNSSQVGVFTDTMALEIDADGIITISGKKTGLARVQAKAVVLASGCRERPIGALPVAGTRPAGVFTAGAAQKMINIGGYDIGNRFVILGSGDVGLIVARELAKRGKEVIAVIEKEDKCGGLPRNRINCLEKYNIPLITRATVSKVHGVGRINGVTVVNSELKGAGAKNSEYYIECDTLITSVGLIPERELLDSFKDDLPDWLFLCGNACFVHDVVDDVTAESELVGRYAAQWACGGAESGLYNSESSPGRAGASDITDTRDAVVCIGCPKSCAVTRAAEGWEGLVCGRKTPEL